jgi:excisionase family DNA binding protein
MPDEQAPDQGLLTPQQVAKRLEVNVRTLWRMAKQDGFPQPVRFSRKLVRWKASDVQRYIDGLQQERQP